jgi:hypothetical protein
LKILITGAKTATALKLSKAFNQFEIILGDYGDLPLINTDSYLFVELGKWNEEVLAHNLLTKCLDFGVEMLLPLYEAEIAAVAKSLVLFEEFNIQVLLTDRYVVEQLSSKNWVVVHKGRLVFSSALQPAKANYETLNGAYYVDEAGKPISTIAIANPI